VRALDVNPLIEEPQFCHFRGTRDIRQPRETSVPSELAFQLGQTYPIPAGIRSDLKIAFVRQRERSHLRIANEHIKILRRVIRLI
jgi:hypothetical protein